MRILALDYGTKRIGLAVSDEGETIARGISTISRKDNDTDINKIKKIISDLDIRKIIIGITYNSDGSISKTGLGARKFSKLIKKETGLPVDFVDETYTSANAENILLQADMSRKRRKEVIDKLSAVIILQEYLNNN